MEHSVKETIEHFCEMELNDSNRDAVMKTLDDFIESEHFDSYKWVVKMNLLRAWRRLFRHEYNEAQNVLKQIL